MPKLIGRRPDHTGLNILMGLLSDEIGINGSRIQYVIYIF